MDQDLSKQVPRDCYDSDGVNCTSSLKEITLIETVTSFLAENGAAEVDPRVLKNLAEALSKRIDSDDTSPGGIQDVTLENSYNSFDAGRKPGGIHSPLQGRSMRELEEQMSTLRKENFNLKLRIYFMEESQHGTRGKATDTTLSKQLIDSKIEIELLRKRVDEKTELLKDAARAISQHEDAQKKSDIENQTMIEEMQQYIYQLESDAKQNATKKSLDALSTEKLKSLEPEVLKLQNVIIEAEQREYEARRQLELLENELADRQESLTACEAKIQELAVKNAELVEQLEKQTEFETLSNGIIKRQKVELSACLTESRRLISDLSSSEHKMQLQSKWIDNAVDVLDVQRQTIKDINLQPEQVRTELANKICELQDAQEKLTERDRVHEQACRTIQKLMQKLNSQEKEINRFKQQANSNEEPKPTKPHSVSDTEISVDDLSRSLKQRYEQQITEQNDLIKQLQAEVKKKTANLQNLVNKELWEKNREVERLTKLVAAATEPSADDSTGASGGAGDQSFSEAEYIKSVKRNKLLQRKVDVLLQRLNELQENGTEVAKLRLELNSMQADVESANKWRLECADVCTVLTNRLEELAGFLNSLLKHKDVLGVLAADRRNAMRRAIDRSLDLSKSLNMTLSITGASLADQSLIQLSKLSEILYTEADAECNRTYNSHEEINAIGTTKAMKLDAQMRKERRSLPLPQQPVDNQSESEAWSEPDRKVSLARIGLEDKSNSLVCGEQHHSESDSEGHACSANSLKQDRSRTAERITQLESLIAQRDERILAAQCELVDADNRLKQEQLRVIEITQQVEQLRTLNQTLLADLQVIGTQEDKQVVELQKLIEEKTQQLEQQRLAHNTLLADAQITEMELQDMQKKMQEMEMEHAVDLDKAHSELLQCKMEGTRRLEEQQRVQHETLARDWVPLTKHEETKALLMEMQRTLEYYQENEKELKQTLVENELTARSLKKELDESTLQASKAIMERTKAYNDKLNLEKRVEELKTQLAMSQEEQRQLQQQQSHRVQGSDVSQSGYTSEEVPQGSNSKTTAGPSSSAAAAVRFSNPSPDLGIESDVGRVMSVELSSAQRTLMKTVELGVGQNSQDLELLATKEDAAASSAAAPGAQTSSSSTIHDCAKVEQEIAELRRKLIRTKRAFEDTYEKLRVVNKAKAQVEKDIKNQILKTHNVLRNVRSNMENVL